MLSKDKVYVIGESENYISIYGYPKRRFQVTEKETGAFAGYIKEEEVPGPPGQPETVCYYTKESWRARGQLRFYQTPEALIVAMGGSIEEAKPKAKPKAKTRIKARKIAKEKTLARAKPGTKKVVKPHRRVTKLAA